MGNLWANGLRIGVAIFGVLVVFLLSQIVIEEITGYFFSREASGWAAVIATMVGFELGRRWNAKIR